MKSRNRLNPQKAVFVDRDGTLNKMNGYITIQMRVRKMAKKYLTCADSNCGYYWQDADEDYPRCHFDGIGKAPCEEDDWEDGGED